MPIDGCTCFKVILVNTTIGMVGKKICKIDKILDLQY